nr:hypothetical protein [Bacteroidota bacterium]
IYGAQILEASAFKVLWQRSNSEDKLNLLGSYCQQIEQWRKNANINLNASGYDQSDILIYLLEYYMESNTMTKTDTLILDFLSDVPVSGESYLTLQQKSAMKISLAVITFCILSSFTFTNRNTTATDICSEVNYILEQYMEGNSHSVESNYAYKPIPGFEEGTTLNYVTRDLHICNYISDNTASLPSAYDKVFSQLTACIKSKPKLNAFGEYQEATFKVKKVTVTLTLKTGDYLKLNFERRTK